MPAAALTRGRAEAPGPGGAGPSSGRAEPEVEVEGGWVLLPRGASGVAAAPLPAAALASSA